ncbi:cell wall hydrolase [Paenibacillus gansuensis]|uniref:Cell wall hydrolase n=1 Tax=Paenibacillus gansuensis TaxID=306542 RepID=A0ABW5P6N2_9BACL
MIVLLIVLAASIPVHVTADKPADSEVTDVKEVVMDDKEAFMDKDRLYVPIRSVVEHGEAKAAWDQGKRRLLVQTSSGDWYAQSINQYKMMFNGKLYITDKPLILRNNRAYMPVRYAAELFHKEAEYVERDQAVHLQDIPKYEVQKGDTLPKISSKLNIPVRLLKERNRLTSDALQSGQQLSTVIPRAMEEKNKMKEMYLLARLVESEAGGEPMKGKVAVANVVLNRVEDNRFPDTIRDVIYAHNQFEVVANGSIERKVPSSDSVEAAQLALNGVNYVPEAVFFYNPSLVRSPFLERLSYVAVIGGHEFKK